MTDNGFSSTTTSGQGSQEAPRTSQYSNTQLERTKQQVEDVKGIMVQNVQRIIERGENLEDLDKKAANLTANANEFQRTSRTLKKKMWWKNLKMMIILGIIVVIVIIIIIVAAVGVPSGGGGGGTGTTPQQSAVSGEGGSTNGGVSKRSLMEVLGEKIKQGTSVI